MSVQTEIDRIITAVHAAHEKVKEKGGTTSEPYLVANLEGAIGSIPEASDPTLQSKTVIPATSQQVVTPDSGYDGLSSVIVNAMPTATQATPSISVSADGLITASATQDAGYVSAGTKSATKQLTVQVAQTITPTTTDQTIASGRYLTGAQTIKGDSNLAAENIKSGVSIFGVTGTHEGSNAVQNFHLTAEFDSIPFEIDIVRYAFGDDIYDYISGVTSSKWGSKSYRSFPKVFTDSSPQNSDGYTGTVGETLIYDDYEVMNNGDGDYSIEHFKWRICVTEGNTVELTVTKCKDTTVVDSSTYIPAVNYVLSDVLQNGITEYSA